MISLTFLTPVSRTGASEAAERVLKSTDTISLIGSRSQLRGALGQLGGRGLSKEAGDHPRDLAGEFLREIVAKLWQISADNGIVLIK